MLTLFEKNIYIIDEVEETLTYMNTEGKICWKIIVPLNDVKIYNLIQ